MASLISGAVFDGALTAYFNMNGALTVATTPGTIFIPAVTGHSLFLRGFTINSNALTTYTLTDGSGGTVIFSFECEANVLKVFNEQDLKGLHGSNGNAIYIIATGSPAIVASGKVAYDGP